MSKLFRITRNPEALVMDIEDPADHYYHEYISIIDPDAENPLAEDFGSKADAENALANLKARFAPELDVYLANYYQQAKKHNTNSALNYIKNREAETIAYYEKMKIILPTLKVVECTLTLSVKEV